MKIVPTEHRQVWGSVKMMPTGEKKNNKIWETRRKTQNGGEKDGID